MEKRERRERDGRWKEKKTEERKKSPDYHRGVKTKAEDNHVRVGARERGLSPRKSVKLGTRRGEL